MSTEESDYFAQIRSRPYAAAAEATARRVARQRAEVSRVTAPAGGMGLPPGMFDPSVTVPALRQAGETGKQVALGAMQGPLDALNAAAKKVNTPLNAAYKAVTGAERGPLIDVNDRQRITGEIPGQDPESMAGGLARGISTFMTLYGPMASALATTGAVGWGGSMAAGAFADMMAFENKTGTLSDVLRQIGLDHEFTQALSGELADDEWEASLRAGLEGAALGVLGPAFRVLRTGLAKWPQYTAGFSIGLASDSRRIASRVSQRGGPPPPPRIGDEDISPARGLPDYLRQFEYRAFEQLRADPKAAVANYLKLPGTDGGRILNVDLAKELFAGYLADRTRSSAFQQPASKVVRDAYRETLRQPPAAGQDAHVVLVAGGSGAGKTETVNSLRDLGPEFGKAQAIYETTLNSVQSASRKIDEALEAGKQVSLLYLWRDPVESLTEGSLPRAMGPDGRTVPLDAHVDGHVDGPEIVRALSERYAGDERVVIRVVDNSLGTADQRLMSTSDLPALDYNVVHEQASSALDAEHAAGRISDAVYDSVRVGVGRRTRSPRRSSGAGGDRRAAPGDREESQTVKRGPDGDPDGGAP